MILLGLSIPTCFSSIPERCILEALLRRVLYCGHSTQYSHLVKICVLHIHFLCLFFALLSSFLNVSVFTVTLSTTNKHIH